MDYYYHLFFNILSLFYDIHLIKHNQNCNNNNDDDHSDHAIYEIRSRALHTLHFKLSHGILVLSDLTQETNLLRALLQWFNITSSSTNQKNKIASVYEDDIQVLTLLKHLAEV